MKYILKFFVTLFYLFFFAIVVAVLFAVMTKCEHTETVVKYSFQFEGSTANSYYKTYCKNCYDDLKTTIFRGTPEDTPYLDVISKHSDSAEIIGGQYYIMTATVTLGDFDFQNTRISCKVVDDDIEVYFSVEFFPEFEEQVSTIETGDIVTFYGRFYEEGCGFKDCKLISE